tara:strand:+ start:5547 stop:5939 length:393 start_codon:yes stop_codon:yes gene_type:complete
MITIFSVNGEYFTNYDLAVLKAAGTNYIIKSHDVNDTVDLEVETDGLNIAVCDEYDNKINVEFQLEVWDITGYEDEQEVKEYRAEDLGINGRSLESLNLSFGLSDELKNSIIHECDNLAIKKTDHEFSRR